MKNTQKSKIIIAFTHPDIIPMWICTFIDIIGYSILIPFLPQFSSLYGASLLQVGLLLSANSFFSLFGNIIWGSLSDKFGRKPILLICQMGTMAGFLILAFSTNMTMLFVSRIVDGIFGGNYPIAKAVVGDVVPPKDRSREMSNIGMAWTIGNMIGPGIGALLARFGIMGPGLMGAGMSLMTIMITIFIFKESNPLVNGSATEDEVQALRQRKAVSFALLKRHDPRLLLGQILSNNIAFYIFITTVSIIAAERFQLTIAQIGWMVTSMGAVKLLGRLFIFNPLLRKFGDVKTALIGFSVFIGAYVWLTLLSSLWEYMAVFVLVGFGTSCTLPVMTARLSRSVGKDQQGEIMGLNTAADNISQIIGPTAGSYFISLPAGFVYGLSMVGFSLLTLLLSAIPLKHE
jgi:DHA1 family tetracycline resistance protein-like MFS transporter